MDADRDLAKMRQTKPNGRTMERRKNSSGHLHMVEPKGAVVFSLSDGAVWASWPGNNAPVHLGHYDSVVYMMRDFLAQCDLAERMSLHKQANQ